MADNSIKIFRNVCPRNCYNTCAILSYVKDGKLFKVEGDPIQGYTKGRLCAKGYAYTEYIYNPNRLRFPLRQYPRGSGNWQKISWEEALTIIAQKLIELKNRYGSNMAAAYNKFSGNLGILHYATEGFFNSIGSHTRPVGNPCLAAGLDALAYDYGQNYSPDPENMVDSKLIVIWGANPAATAVHQFNFINKAREKGAKLVVIDPVFTTTAAKADLYIQIRPGTDGLLALAIAKLILIDDKYDLQFISERVEGWEPFRRYLIDKVSIDEAIEVTGVPLEGIQDLAAHFAALKPCANWVGFGLQRHFNGGQNVRAISALGAMTGNIGIKGSGLYYFHPSTDIFPLKFLNSAVKSRTVDINHFASEVHSLNDPPVKFLWVACRNPLSQDQDIKAWMELLRQMDLVVTVDLYMTQMAAQSDIVLPAASPFEDYDLNVSYWHYWLSLNEQAIAPFYEAKSDLEIARALSSKLNELSPNFSNFPCERTSIDWIKEELTPEVLKLFGLNHWEELRKGPAKLNQNLLFQNEKHRDVSKKFQIYSRAAKQDNLPAISKFNFVKENQRFPLTLLTPQRALRLHSQYANLTWLKANNDQEDDILKINPKDANDRGIREGEFVLVFNNAGKVKRIAKLTEDVPRGVLVAFQGEATNHLLTRLFTDMGKKQSGSNGVAYYDANVEVRRLQEKDLYD